MKRIRLFLLLFSLVNCLACSRPPVLFDKPYTTVARLGDSTWYGRASATEASALSTKPCANGKMTVFLSTTLGYPGDRVRLSTEQAAMQAGEFVPRQRLTFYNVPAKRGKYHLFILNQCDDIASRQGNFVLLLNGSGIVASFFAKTKRSGWVRITAIDSVARTVSGRFRAILVSPAGRVATFKRGRFSAVMPRKEQ